MKWGHWLQGLIGAGINSAASAFTAIVVAPSTFNVATAGGWARIGSMVGVSSLLGFALYLKRSPLPETSVVESVTITKEVTKGGTDV